MKPTNVHTRDQFLVDHQCVFVQESRDKDQETKTGNQRGKKPKKGRNLASRTFKTEEKFNLAHIIHNENSYLSYNTTDVVENDAENEYSYSFYDHLDENLNYKIETEYQIETKYAWAHLSCANYMHEIEYTAKSPLKIGKLNPDRFEKACIICCQKNGAGIKCCDENCDVWMHGE